MKSLYLSCLLSTLCITLRLYSAQSSNPNTPSSSSSTASRTLVATSAVGVAGLATYVYRRHKRKLNTTLKEAVERQDMNEILRLKEKGADPNHKLMVDAYISFGLTNEGRFFEPLPLLDHVLIEFKDDNVQLERGIRYLLKKGRASANYTNRFGRTPLHYAPKKDIAFLLLDADARIDVPDQFGRTPLHEAARHEEPAIVQELIDQNALCSAQDNEGRTALDLIINRTPNKKQHDCVIKLKRSLQRQYGIFLRKLTDLHSIVYKALKDNERLNNDVASVIGEYTLDLDPAILTSNPAPVGYVDPADTHIQRWVAETIATRKRRKEQLQALGAVVKAAAAGAAAAALTQPARSHQTEEEE